MPVQGSIKDIPLLRRKAKTPTAKMPGKKILTPASASEPFFGPARRPKDGAPSGGGGGEGPGPSNFRRLTGNAMRAASQGAQTLLRRLAQSESRSPLIYVKDLPPAEERFSQDARNRMLHGSALPPLSLLAAMPKGRRTLDAFDPGTMERANALMGDLGDFGVKGRISGVYPGPVITLFELEPGRGTKSSRV